MARVLTETWRALRDYPGYERSTFGRVRGPAGIVRPFPFKGMLCFSIEGERVCADALDSGLPCRTLSRAEKAEIRSLEGVKTPFEVADEFNIHSDEVLNLWDHP